MAQTVDQALVEKFTSNVHFLGQQRMSRLFDTVRRDSGTADKFAFERVAMEDMVEKTTRRTPTPELDTEHTRRYAVPSIWHWGDTVESADQVRALINLDNTYVQTAGMAHGRRIDKHIINAAGGSALDGDRTTTIALPAGQKIQAATPGSPLSTEILTVATLRKARKMLRKAEVWGNWVMVISSEQEEQLLDDPEFTNADFNIRKPLAEGGVDGGVYLGFRFKVTELLPLTGNSRLAYAYVDRAIGLAIADEKKVRIGEDPSISFANRVYMEQVMGAVRIEDEGVVEIETYEA